MEEKSRLVAPKCFTLCLDNVGGRQCLLFFLFTLSDNGEIILITQSLVDNKIE